MAHIDPPQNMLPLVSQKGYPILIADSLEHSPVPRGMPETGKKKEHGINVGKTMPLIIINRWGITIENRWYAYHCQMGGLWHCFTTLAKICQT